MHCFKPARHLFAFLFTCSLLLGGMPGQFSQAQAKISAGMAAEALVASSALGFKYDWHTFYGLASDIVELRGAAADTNGNVYVAGYANNTWGSPLHAHSGGRDVVVIKLDSEGAYQWHTFYGSSPVVSEDGDDEASSLVVDTEGNVYLTGYSDKSWQGPGNANPLHNHGDDAEYMFLLKLNSSGAYQWHTFYQPGRATALTLDSLSSTPVPAGLYITGYSSSEWGTPIHSAAATNGNLVIIKLNTDGAYQWHTYYGGSVGAGDESGYGISAPARSDVYVTGTAAYSWQGDGDTPPLNGFSGGEGYSTDIVVLKLSKDGVYQWHTFYGASGSDDAGQSIARSGSRLFIAGSSYDTWGSPLHAYSSEGDIAVLQLDTDGAYQWNTFYGSGANDNGRSLKTDANSNAYIAGWSNASWLGDGDAAPRHPHSGDGGADIMVLKLNSGGQYQRHTFYGASATHDYGLGLALRGYSVFVTGTSHSSWLGDGNAAPIHPHSGNTVTGDSYVLKLDDEQHDLYLPLIRK